ncbi:MAG TPA: hypothetical protein PL155_02250 [Candidatus Omnitrophota bacterium]|nr:hypothetical protein [Candidatus Omnitrophota bacterium]HPD84693.1 hypothetical protein [Candidatus Omnitrophota bacterium]HRZ03551.1 hypothetical protein [Candidatus Omnitrophota bacterium]
MSKKGSLLVEALLTISILSIGLTVVIRSLVSSLKATAYSADYSMAVILLGNEMSDLRQKGFIKDSIDIEDIFPEPYEKFFYRLETKKVVSESTSGLLNEVKLTVFWRSGPKERSISAVTYLLQPPA